MPTRFTIDGFKSNMRDVQRSNLFYFLPNFPPDVVVGDMSNDRAVYLVKTTNLPSTTMEEVLLNWQGMDFPFAGKHTFAELPVTFNTDIKSYIRQNFENWINKIHNPVTNEYALINEYMLDQRLQLLGNDGETVMEFVLHDAWPREVAQATLDYSANEATIFDVTFRYSYHTYSAKGTGA
jgi:hypothetical protein